MAATGDPLLEDPAQGAPDLEAGATLADATPPPGWCRTRTPSDPHKIVVAGKEYDPPDGLRLTNWASPDVYHYEHSPELTAGTFSCRLPGDVIEVLVHETAGNVVCTREDLEHMDNSDHFGVHFVVLRDGAVWQCNDVIDRLVHAGTSHNEASVAIETVSPVVPRLAPPDAPRIEETVWGHRDRYDHDDDDSTDRIIANPRRAYVLPPVEQLEAVSLLIEWLAGGAEHGLGIPRSWVGIQDDRILMDKGEHRGLSSPEAGIWAHGYEVRTDHVDSFFHILYAWLRLESHGGAGLPASEAYELAIDLAAHAVSRARDRSMVIDLTPHL